MASVSFFVFFVLSHLLLLHSAEDEMKYNPDPNCPPFLCGELGWVGFPFTNSRNPECRLHIFLNCSEQTPKIQLKKNKKIKMYDIESIQPHYDDVEDMLLDSTGTRTIAIKDEDLSKPLNHYICDSFHNLTLSSLLLPLPSYISFQFTNKTLFKCNRPTPNSPFAPDFFNYTNCSDFDIYYSKHPDPVDKLPTLPPPQCSIIQLPLFVNETANGDGTDLFKLLDGGVLLFEMRLFPYHEDCYNCLLKGGQCRPHRTGEFNCAEKKGNKLKLILPLSIGLPGILIIACCFFFLRRHYKKKYASTMLARNISSRSDMEGGSFYFGASVFSYSELKEATNNFDLEKELGDGGFGTVYYGKLRDGREVAVKRLYEHNYRRVEQFMNEIEILTKLRHKNLVSLYGCTSRHSRELLLLYEYIPNGTVADHIHGDRATPGSPTWPTRMSIAIETASALSYLHASEIIHRDVKTNNILLDNSFCVKVADFGLSRLFPINVSHVSTAPQGTPGYVDPEYRQCYQLTIKSDVYSFGVVLIELISSLPAVDITRHRHEINLSNLAINKIQNSEFNELIDLHLGFESDNEVKRMTILVAKLAFQCLQPDKETRPSMVEVLEALKKIQSGEDESEDQEKADDDAGVLKPPTSPDSNEVGLLKNTQLLPTSPNSVTDKWSSRSTTPSASGNAATNS